MVDITGRSFDLLHNLQIKAEMLSVKKTMLVVFEFLLIGEHEAVTKEH